MNNKAQKGINLFIFFSLFFAYWFNSTAFAASNSGQLPENAAETNSHLNDFADPYEKFNRVIFNFNEHLDAVILKPIATFYNLIVPKPLNEGIHNVFNNIGNLPTIANDLLQIKFHQAANDFWRFGINSTIGIGGLFDVAAKINLPPSTNDFGLTLAKWGYKQSNYLVLPFFGPSSLRDGIALPVDYYLFSIYPHIHSDEVRYSVYGLSIIDKRARLLKYQPVLEEAAVDKYVFVRNAYQQHRNYQISEKVEPISSPE